MAIGDLLQKIPQPPPKPIIGNALDVDAHARAESMMHLARKYGPIFQLMTPVGVTVVVSGYELVNELCDQGRFKKRVGASLKIVRGNGSPSLFTSETDDPIWRKAHNILMPNFSLRVMKGYHTMMLDIAVQLMDKWSRLNFDDDVDVPGDMTRLTLDTIGLCGFDYRFNSFYRDEPHPFVHAMTAVLTESMTRPARLPVEKQILFYKEIQFNQNMKYMNGIVNTVIHERRESGQDKNDLLGCMLNQPDKETGEKLDDDNIRAQIITFLIAGHETTSGLLSFAIYLLLKYPLAMKKAREEVDRVFGADVAILPTYSQVNQLQYIQQVLSEALRLWPTAPGFSLAAIKDEEILGDTYRVTKDDAILAFSLMLHRDKSVWGDDAEEFKPERFSPEKATKIPPNAYKPFGNGIRACIGRQFALQEATLVLGMLLQRFELIDYTDYELKLKETLTIKPDNFKIKVKPYKEREMKVVPGQPYQVSVQADKHEEQVKPGATTGGSGHNTPLLLLFGSNTGTAEDLAHQIAADGDLKGFATTVAPLDDYTNKLPQKGAIIIVTASYNGQPPDDAVQFCAWLKSGNVASATLQGVKYTVFGCGNTDWADTYQAVPKLIDNSLAEFGATRLYQRGEGNVKADFDGQFQAWYKELWDTLAERLSLQEAIPQDTKKVNLYTVELITNEEVRSVLQSAGVRPMQVVTNLELTKNDGMRSWERAVNHLQIEVPDAIQYVTGDHLGVIAQNNVHVVRRVLRRFGFDEFTRIRISQNSDRKTLLPIGDAITASRLLSLYVELQSVATRSQIATLANYVHDPAEKQRLAAIGDSDELYQGQVLKPRKSVIDLLEEYPGCDLPFNIYLEMLPIMHPRFYSISSSPLKDARSCSITVARVEGPALSGHGTFKGVCSNFLNDTASEDNILGFIQKTATPFRLPDDSSTPLIMVGPGTGVAPFRAFLQERAVQKERGAIIGKSMLFFGCRDPQCDFLYKDELKEFERQGITELYTAFSRIEGQPRCHVQQRIREQKDKVWSLIQNGAYIYVCGDATRMAPDVQKTFMDIYQEKTRKSEQAAKAWIDELASQRRYQVDIWEANS